MNYIPGFSNYLQASVPRYAQGGRARYDEDNYDMGDYDMGGYDAAPIMDAPRQAAVMPMTQEAAPAAAPAAAPYDLSALAGLDFSGLNNLSGMNFASDFGGGPSGSTGYIADPNLQYFQAPVSNSRTNTGVDGSFYTMTPDQKVRLVDLSTNKVVYEGTGYDAARKATEMAQGLTDTLGRKAQYIIQTADPSGVYKTVASEDYNKSTLGQIADVVGTALPIAVSLIPGLQLLGPVVSQMVASGAGAALKGQDPLKAAALAGLTAGAGDVLGPTLGTVGNMGLRAGTAVGTGLGAVAGNLATGQNLENSLLGGVASGALSYAGPTIQQGLGINPTSGSIFRGGDTSVGGYGGPNAEIVVNAPAFSTPNINLGGFKTPTQNYLDEVASNATDPAAGSSYNSGYDGDIINVTGSVPGAVSGGLNLGGLMADPVANPVVNATDEIVVSGTRPGAVTGGLNLGGLSPEVAPAIGGLENFPTEIDPIAEDEIIKVTGQRPSAVTGGVNLGGLTTTNPPVLPNDIVVDATKVVKPDPVPVTTTNPVVNGVDQVTKEIVATAPKVVKPDPVPVTGGLTLSDAALKDIDAKSAEEKAKEEEAKKKLGFEDYLELLSLLPGLIPDGKGGSGSSGTYVPGGRGLNPIFSVKLPTANIPGGVGAASNLGARRMGEQDWLTYGQRPELSFYNYVPQPNPAPVTQPVPNNPAGPSMYVRDDMRFAEGGALPAARGGQSRRTEFAVNGPGTGRSDDIPAVLSDGEYVIDAETVALLGDGSSKAGAKKLDELRIKVRKHKGKKLAKGRFSANAKRPEAYLSGGRV